MTDKAVLTATEQTPVTETLRLRPKYVGKRSNLGGCMLFEKKLYRVRQVVVALGLVDIPQPAPLCVECLAQWVVELGMEPGNPGLHELGKTWSPGIGNSRAPWAR